VAGVDAAPAVATELFPEDPCWVAGVDAAPAVATELFPEDACWVEAQAVRTLIKPSQAAQAAILMQEL
jgi:hypothetical protein